MRETEYVIWAKPNIYNHIQVDQIEKYNHFHSLHL